MTTFLAEMIAIGQRLLTRQPTRNILQIARDVAPLLMLAHAETRHEGRTRRTFDITMTIVGNWVRAFVNAPARLAADGRTSPTMDWRRQNRSAAVTRQFVERHVWTCITVSFMAGFFTLMPSTGKLLPALFGADVIPECAAGFAAFVTSATHLLIALPVAKELSILPEHFSGCSCFNDASFLNHFLAVHLASCCSTKARHVAFLLARRTSAFVTFGLAKMALPLMISTRQRFAANAAASRDRILARSPLGHDRVRFFIRRFLFITSLCVPLSANLAQSGFPARTPLHRLWQPRTRPAISGVTGFSAAMAFDAASELFAALELADKSRRQIDVAVVSLRRLAAAAADIDANGTFGAWWFVADRVA